MHLMTANIEKAGPPGPAEIARRRQIGETLAKKILANRSTVISKADALTLLDFWAGGAARNALELQGVKAGIKAQDESEAS